VAITNNSSSKTIDELELGAQQDVTEVIGNVLFQLECAMRADGADPRTGEQHDEIKRLFYGRSKAHIEAGGAPRINEEYFADIKVNVADGPKDIYEALDGAFDAQEVSLEDGTHPQYTSISQLPPILQIHVQRVQYDKASKKMYKSDSQLKLRETIYLDRYMESEDPELLEKRRQAWKWKDALEALHERRAQLVKTEVAGLGIPEVLDLTSEWLLETQRAEGQDQDGEKVVGDDEGAIEELRLRAQQARDELSGPLLCLSDSHTGVDTDCLDSARHQRTNHISVR
jgi:ubiquitin carboxyl-terminal hydrolase 25/28